MIDGHEFSIQLVHVSTWELNLEMVVRLVK